MKRYILNQICEPTGEYHVHESSCYKLPSYVHQLDLGYHSSCAAAVEMAKKTHPDTTGCYHCSRMCHTSG